MKNSLYTHAAPYVVGVQRRAEERSLSLWLAANENRIINGIAAGSGPKLPPGWYYEDCSIPAIPGSRINPPMPPLPRFRLRRGVPPPPLKPRPRILDLEDGHGWRLYSDAELEQAGWDPAEFEPYELPPDCFTLPLWAQGLILVICIAGFLSLALWLGNRPAQPEPETPVVETALPYRVA